ncbi:nucleotide exchange factor GrpE [Natronomonas sp.]|uniref:nucleotide exchange factor GrpE n=1 Tax=Natronomonas sp. TaxID=2184060 RepID=UPI00261B9D56|nr:nucleotide exchange factor GrpE [Natronomonas sp.]
MSDEQGDAGATAGAEPATDAEGAERDEPSADATEDATEPPLAEIADRIERSDPGEIAEEIAALREEAVGLRTDRDDLEARLKRKQAEFQNYKKRQEKQRKKERARATESLVEDLLEVRDNLTRALSQDADADIREGVEATFRQLEEVLEGEGVEPVEPDPGTPTDPVRHEVLLGVESDRPEGTVAEVHRPGYEMAGKVLRPAQVTVSQGPADADDQAATEPTDDDGTESGSDPEERDAAGDE